MSRTAKQTSVEMIDLLNGTNITGLYGSVLYTGDIAPIVNITIQNNLTVLQFGIIVVMTYIMAILFHELGHWIALKILKKDPALALFCEDGKVKLLTAPNELTETPEQRLFVIITGILLGYLAIGLGSLLHPYVWLVAVPYSLGFTGDIKLLAENLQEKIKRDKVTKK